MANEHKSAAHFELANNLVEKNKATQKSPDVHLLQQLGKCCNKRRQRLIFKDINKSMQICESLSNASVDD